MPARPRTPSPASDEPRYLTVVWPYPMHANMELLGELKECVFWLASCIGPDALLAVFNKPSSPNMIIIEVERSFDSWNSLLGEHKWGEFLRNPTFEEKDRVSQIFYCTLTTGRKVQKNGWKRNDVESSWFHGSEWTPYNRIITRPYPATSYCPTPPEEKTSAPLCRPLPVKSFPPPPPTRRPPVGSPEWLRLREQETKKIPVPPAPQGAWALGAPATRTSAPGSTRAGPARGVPALAAGNARPGAPARNASTPNGPTLPPGINIAIPSRSANRNNGSASTMASPGSPDGDWLGVPPALTRGPSTASGSSDGSGSGQLTPGADGAHVNGEQFANAMAALALNDDGWDGEGDDSLLDQQWVAPGGYVLAGPLTDEDEVEPAAEAEPQFEWAGYTFNDAANGPKEPEIECKEHGKLCKKGICKQYKSQKREVERQREAAERLAEKERKIIEKKKRKNDAGKTKYNLLPQRNAQTPGTLILPTNAAKVPDRGWAKAPAGAAVSPINDPPAGDAATQRPAKGRRMNAATSADVSISGVGPGTRNAMAGPASDGGSTTGGWGNVSTGPWGGSAPAPRANNAGVQEKKPPSSVASSGWGNASNGPWPGPQSAAAAAAVAKRPPSSVASSGWGTVSDGPWAPPPGSSKPNPARKPLAPVSAVSVSEGPWPGLGGVKKKGPSSVVSVASSASGWGNASNGQWPSRPATEVGYSDGEDDDARTVDGRDEEEEEEEERRGRPGGSVWGRSQPGGSVKGSVKGSGNGSLNGAQAGLKKSWADQVEDEDNKSVTSSKGGWGNVSAGPW